MRTFGFRIFRNFRTYAFRVFGGASTPVVIDYAILGNTGVDIECRMIVTEPALACRVTEPALPCLTVEPSFPLRVSLP
jgi:hypothetical protein